MAPPDRHLVLHEGRVELECGPPEHWTRPAIDPLFRSAAAAFGSRVCGVLLSGNLRDGCEGLRAVVAAGGTALVQRPDDAEHDDMPRNALGSVGSAEALSSLAIGRRLAQLSQAPGPPSTPTPDEVAGALWAATRALREEASVARSIADQARSDGSSRTTERFDGRRETAERHARVLEDLLLQGDTIAVRRP